MLPRHTFGSRTVGTYFCLPRTQESESSGSYEKKVVTLTVMESADVSGRNPTEVGSLTVNLAEFASPEGRAEEQRKPVKTSGAITTVVGDPFLAFTIRCARGARS